MINPNLLQVTARAGINQIRGINPSGATGSGIPKHVTNVSTSMANASVGSTSTVSVTFRRDPGDINFSGVTVLVKGYQGNQTPTQVASGTDSPISFILNNTGEALSVTVQATGNGGSAPITTAPTAGLTLPKSTSGVGTNTTTSALTLKTNGTTNSTQTLLNLKPGSNITVAESAGAVTITAAAAISGSPGVGQLAKFASPATTVTGADLTGDATTAGTVATTVVKVRGTTVSATAPLDRQILQYSKKDGQFDLVPFARPIHLWHALQNNTALAGSNQGLGVVASAFGSPTAITATKATSTEPPYCTFNTLSTANSQAWFSLTDGSASSVNNPWLSFQNTVQVIRWRILVPAVTSVRMWIGLSDATNGTVAIGALVADAPAANFIGFRFSTAAGDTHWQAVTQTAAVSQTKTDTGVTPNTTGHTFTITYDGTNAVFFIDDLQVAVQSGNLPSSSTLLSDVVSVDNVNAANLRSFSIANFYLETI